MTRIPPETVGTRYFGVNASRFVSICASIYSVEVEENVSVIPIAQLTDQYTRSSIIVSVATRTETSYMELVILANQI